MITVTKYFSSDPKWNLSINYPVDTVLICLEKKMFLAALDTALLPWRNIMTPWLRQFIDESIKLGAYLRYQWVSP